MLYVQESTAQRHALFNESVKRHIPPIQRAGWFIIGLDRLNRLVSLLGFDRCASYLVEILTLADTQSERKETIDKPLRFQYVAPYMETAESKVLQRMAQKWADEAPALLREAYGSTTGLRPPASWSFKMDKSASLLAQMEQDGENVPAFLREQMAAFVLRCGGGLGQAPEASFFADSYCLAASAIEWLEGHQARVRRFLFLTGSPEAFPKKVYEDVLLTEQQYWAASPNQPPILDLIAPTLYWVVFSKYFGRFGDAPAKKNAPHHGLLLEPYWPVWSHTVDYFGQEWPLQKAWSKERERLRRDAVLTNIAIDAARRALRDASTAAYCRHGLGQIMLDTKNQFVLPSELSRWEYCGVESGTLWDWELRWREFLAGKLGQPFNREAFIKVCQMPAVDKSTDKAWEEQFITASSFMSDAVLREHDRTMMS